MASWEEVELEREETYALSNANTIPEAVKNIVSYLGMQPCDRTDRVPEGKSSHSLALAGNLSITIKVQNPEDLYISIFTQVYSVEELKFLQGQN